MIASSLLFAIVILLPYGFSLPDQLTVMSVTGLCFSTPSVAHIPH
jgi:hypothetical protein